MKLTCILQMFNENTHKGWDKKTNLERFLDSTSRYCDSLIIYDDGSFDNSVDLAKSYNNKFEDLIILDNNKNDFRSELAHKQKMLEISRGIHSTHVLWLDTDEVIEKRGEQGIRELCESGFEDYDGVNFPQINMWRSDRYYRVDKLWGMGLFCRLWKLSPKLYFAIKKGLHQDLAPRGLNGRTTTTLNVIHYGFSTSDNILRKYYMYKNHGQKGHDLNRLIDESSLRVKLTPSKMLHEGPFGPETEIYNTPLKEML